MRLISLVSLVLFASFLQSGGAQNAQPTPTGKEVRPAAIVGKLEPHKIPDNVAWRMLFFVLADGPSTQSYEQRSAHLKDTKLTPREMEIVVAAASRFMQELRGAEKRILESGASMEEKTAQLRFECDKLVTDAISQIDRDFGFDAHQKIHKHIVEKVKPAIVLTPDN
jgi:hypothetical protein